MPSTPAGTEAFCFQCNSSMCSHVPRGVQRTMAFSLSALILFIPANVLPILSMSKFGYETKSTIWQGGVALWKSGTPGIAVLVLLCSIGIPLAKITGLLYLCATWKNNQSTRNSHLLRLIEAIGRWSMLDVFLVAILVALVKLGALATVAPQLGLVAFCAVVVLTMVASSNFDSRLLWKNEASE
jgi:paraquat-inducible protein A